MTEIRFNQNGASANFFKESVNVPKQQHLKLHWHHLQSSWQKFLNGAELRGISV